MTELDLLDIHRRMVREATLAGGRINAVYYCPHNWEDGCECRKPKPGMLFQAQRDFNLDLTRTLLIGDDERDVEAAEAAGCPSALVSAENPLSRVIDRLLEKQSLKRKVNI
jgi:D-glycero-D-manno-heptose 1,7-bisphosphate phosphatase